jgi:CHASE2 domain-containing sensor protein
MLLPAGALNRQNTWLAVRAFCAGSVMALAAWFLRDQFILVPITVGAMVYAILVLVFRVLAPDDLSLFREIASSFLSRARPSNVATGGTE